MAIKRWIWRHIFFIFTILWYLYLWYWIPYSLLFMFNESSSFNSILYARVVKKSCQLQLVPGGLCCFVQEYTAFCRPSFNSNDFMLGSSTYELNFLNFLHIFWISIDAPLILSVIIHIKKMCHIFIECPNVKSIFRAYSWIDRETSFFWFSILVLAKHWVVKIILGKYILSCGKLLWRVFLAFAI